MYSDQPIVMPKPSDLKKGWLKQNKEKIFYSAGCAYELTKWLIVFLIFISLVHFFVATMFIVDGISMEPNYHTGQFVIVNRWQ